MSADSGQVSLGGGCWTKRTTEWVCKEGLTTLQCVCKADFRTPA